MSSLHPNEQPETGDELDDVLDNLLTEARRDLHTAVERVLDHDRGREAIVGSPTTRAGTRRATPAAVRPSRSTREPRLATRLLAQWIDRRIHNAKNTASWASADEVSIEGRIQTLRNMIKRDPTLSAALQDLHELQEGLAQRRLSRGGAVKLVERIEHRVHSVPPTSSAAARALSLMASLAAFVAGATLAAIVVFGQFWPTVVADDFRPFGAVGVIFMAASIAAMYRRSAMVHRRGRLGRDALTEVQGLRHAIARLFDDSHDETVQTGR